ncbi:LicD family-domain-containing protein [Xylogone sp. PMI_703]|nr:LicD family-domain-containing protein [Xylogone sp. PMI_703]
MKFSKFASFFAATTFLSAPSIASSAPSFESTNISRKRDADNSAPKLVPRDKYFNEPGGGYDLGHYDIRYFTGEAVSYEKRGETLRHLIRAYLTSFRERNIETWIAHGTLLGWWWNGKIMPWDWDLDVQVSSATLDWLGQNLNMTMHNYTSVAPDENGKDVETVHQYLLDVNPNGVERTRGDGLNVIDARFIDISTGLFIDITALSETNPSGAPGVWSCKNYHRYLTNDLYPLRETVFEGVPALVPYAFDKILTEEYGKQALTKTLHEGHRWNPEQKEWIKEQGQEPLKAKRAVKRETPSDPLPHVPRSLLGDENPSSGLRNLARLFWR